MLDGDQRAKARIGLRGDAGVTIMQAVDVGGGNHLALFRQLNLARDRRVSIVRQGRADFVEIREVLAEDAQQMTERWRMMICWRSARFSAATAAWDTRNARRRAAIILAKLRSTA